MDTVLYPGYRFFKTLTLAEEDIRQGALACGDMNYIHHDAERAAKTRFGGLIASGSAISALFSAMLPSHFSVFSPMLGLEMNFKFSAPILAGQTITMEWQIEQINPKAGGKKTLTLKGKIVDLEGNVLVLAAATIMLLPSL
ncbi:MaoC family dehydratase [Bowmanella denitrificans]|uniref:MaoC family dehydratase n=1 Tax=Bowmanella denitrificans TaxID=366582 RepID=A0ABP3GJA5_9ALTE